MQIKDRSHFVFIAISSIPDENSEDKKRFIKDIFHSIYVLQQIGVQGQNITIVSDWESKEWEENGFPPINPISPNNLYATLETINCENLFIISCCHGSICGIGGIDGIRPDDLISSIKSNSTMKNCVVFLGQCYAGVFNYTNVTSEGQNIVYIGATGMRTGISSSTTWNITPTSSLNWIANISVFYMFEWLSKPVDVDNDGHYSVIDLYKYVSYHTNSKTEQIEKEETKRFLQSQIKLELSKLVSGNEDSLLVLLEAAADKAMMKYIVPHQDCWILNAIPASHMYFEF